MSTTLLLLTVDTESSMVGTTPLPTEQMVYGRVDGETWGIERIMDCCDARGVKATFFVSTLEELHDGEDHVRRMCSAILERGHDAQMHVHPNWWKNDFARKWLTDYSLDEQRELVRLAKEAYVRACGAEPLAHRAGGLLVNADLLRAVAEHGIGIDASVAPGYRPYDLGAGVAEPTVPRRIGSLTEVPVTTFTQLRLGRWELGRNFDINADSLAELKFVVDRATAQGVAAVVLLMHSFSFGGRAPDGSRFWPAPREVRKFERFLDYAVAHDGIEIVTFRDLAGRLAADPGLLDGPEFRATSGVARTYLRSWERFGTGWRSKAFALALPLAAAGLAAALVGAVCWLAS